MKRFVDAQRVHVRRDRYGNAIMCAGTVARLRRSDNAAWIALDVRSVHCPFPPDDGPRSTHVIAYPDDCEATATPEPVTDTMPRPPGCLCTWEQGDSACPVHPTCPGCGALPEQCACAP